MVQVDLSVASQLNPMWWTLRARDQVMVSHPLLLAQLLGCLMLSMLLLLLLQSRRR